LKDWHDGNSGKCLALAFRPQPFITNMGDVNDDDVDLGFHMVTLLQNVGAIH
jgi:hypothetical protein